MGCSHSLSFFSSFCTVKLGRYTASFHYSTSRKHAFATAEPAIVCVFVQKAQ
jgi:hypothetical protein